MISCDGQSNPALKLSFFIYFFCRRSPTFEFDNGPIVIGDGVWVATRATVLRGITIGDDAVIGATALVTRDVAAGATVLAPVGQHDTDS